MEEYDLEEKSSALLEDKETIANLLNAIPGGIAVYKTYLTNSPVLLYFNDGVCEISGYSRKEIQLGNPLDVCKAIDEDSSKVSSVIKVAYETGKRANTIYRTRTKAGSIKYIQLTANIVNQKSKNTYTYVIYNDITEQEQQKIAVQLQNEEMHRIADTVPGGIFRCKNEHGWHVIDANDGFYKFLGYTPKEFEKLFHNDMINVIYPDDVAEIEQNIANNLDNGGHIKSQSRLICKDGNTKLVDMQAYRMVNKSGTDDYLYCVFVDISEQAELKQQLKLYRSSNLSGVFTVAVDEYFTHIYGNDKFYAIHEYTKESLATKLNNHSIEYVHPDDREFVRKTIYDVLKKGDNYAEWEMRIITSKGNVRYTVCSGAFEVLNNGEKIINGVIIDITEQNKTEEALRISEEKFRIATDNSDVSFWTYELKPKTIINTAASKRRHENVDVVYDVPNSLIQSGYVRKDSVKAFEKLYEDLANGSKTASADIWFRDIGERNWWCEHIDYTNVFDEKGKPIRAYAVGKDVTATKIAEKKYLEEVAYSQATQSENLLVKVRSNITQNIVESYIAKDVVGISKDNTPYDVGTEQLAMTGFTEQEQNMIREYLNGDRVLKAFCTG